MIKRKRPRSLAASKEAVESLSVVRDQCSPTRTKEVSLVSLKLDSMTLMTTVRLRLNPRIKRTLDQLLMAEGTSLTLDQVLS